MALGQLRAVTTARPKLGLFGPPSNEKSEPIKLANLRRKFARHVSHQRTGKRGCIEWIGAKWGPYGAIRINGKKIRTHRVAFFLKHGRWPEPCCLHTCDNPPCVNDEHLFEGTFADNSRDMALKNRHGRAKLSPDQVREVRASSERGTDIAQRLGVSRSLISYIRSGKIRTLVT